MAGSDEPSEGDMGAALTTRVASLVGRELLVRELSNAGLAPQDAETAVTEIASALSQNTTPDEADVKQLIAPLEIGLQELIDEGGSTYAAIVDQSADLATKNIGALGGGSEIAELARDILYALGLLLFVAKLHLKFDFQSGNISGGIKPGIPAAFQKLLADLAKALAEAIRKRASEGTKTGSGDSGYKPIPHASERKKEAPLPPQTPVVKSPTPSDSQSEFLPASEPHPNYSLPRFSIPQRPMPLREALEVREELFERLNGWIPRFVELLARQFGAPSEGGLWPETQFTRMPAGFARKLDARGPLDWPFDVPFSFGVGLLASPREQFYRLAIRVQSPREMRQKVVRWLSDGFKEQSPTLSVRWSSPIAALATNANGSFRPWAGPVPGNGRAAVGSALNVSGGAVGALSLLLRKGDDHYGATAGHPLWDDDGRANPSGEVYCEPQSVTPNPLARVGTVEHIEVLPRMRLGQSGRQPHARDFALVRLNASALPATGRTNMINGKPFETQIYPMPATITSQTGDGEARQLAEIFGQRVEKSAAKTGGGRGFVNQVGVMVQILDPITNQPLLGTNLIEVVMDPGAEVQCGDSGSLLCIESDQKLYPLGFIVAGQRMGRLHKIDGHSAVSVYAQSFASVAPISGMGVI